MTVFTNQWDSTQPTDLDQVAAGAADFRNLRTDVQQRMAAISGIDAAKPNFGGDAQPLQWQGILFFATDTARVYQWSGSVWVDVTANIGSGGGGGGAGGVQVLDKNTVGPTVSNSTLETTVFTTSVPVLSTTAILRVTTNIVMDTIVTPCTFFWRLNGTVLKQQTYTGPNSTPPNGLIGSTLAYQLWMSNRSVTNNQDLALTLNSMVGTTGFGLGTVNATGANIDTSTPSVLTLSVADAAAGNTQTFNLWLVELL